MTTVLLAIVWWLGGAMAAGAAFLIGVVASIHMYRDAHRDGFRCGYLTAVDDCEDLGPVYERLEQ